MSKAFQVLLLVFFAINSKENIFPYTRKSTKHLTSDMFLAIECIFYILFLLLSLLNYFKSIFFKSYVFVFIFPHISVTRVRF